MKEIKKIFKGVEKFIDENYIERKVMYKQIQKLEKERKKLIKNRTDRVYDNYKTDELVNIINIKIDTIKNIVGGKNV